MIRVAVTSRSFSNQALLRERLADRYEQVSFNETGKTLKGQALIDFLKGHDAAIVGLEKFDLPILQQLPELKIISRFGAGIDSLDIAALQTLGIKLSYTPGANKRAVAELVIAFALTLLRELPRAHQMVKTITWQSMVGRQLSGKTIGIIGLGAIGKDLATLLQAFECNIVAYDIIDHTDYCKTHHIQQIALNELLQVADIVSLHLPITTETRHLINYETLNLMKSTAILINTSRGGLVDEVALKFKLQQQGIAGAAFDVFTIEPPSDHGLLSLPNFFATPHIAGTTQESILAIGHAAIDGLEKAEVPTVTHFC